jgi:hypothetical protein
MPRCPVSPCGSANFFCNDFGGSLADRANAGIFSAVGNKPNLSPKCLRLRENSPKQTVNKEGVVDVAYVEVENP